MDLRPLTLGELLDRTFTLYRGNVRLFVGVMAVPSTVAMALAVLIAWFQHMTERQAAVPGDAAAIPPEVLTAIGMLAGITLLSAMYLVVYAVALGATSFAVSEQYLGRSVSIADVYGRVRGRVGRLVWLMVILAFRVGGVGFAGMLLTSIAVGIFGALTMPAIVVLVFALGTVSTVGLCAYMMLRYGVAVPALLLENLTAGIAVARSVELTKGSLGRVFLIGLCATVITYAGVLLIQGPFIFGGVMAGPATPAKLWFDIGGAVAGSIAGTFTGPILIIALALMYYDTRIRKEGLDLDLMIEALDQRESGSGPARA